MNTTDGVAWSGYRFHDMDPIIFNNGFKMIWRNGDILFFIHCSSLHHIILKVFGFDQFIHMLDAAGIKCLIETGGSIAGSPTASQVQTYAWVYSW